MSKIITHQSSRQGINQDSHQGSHYVRYKQLNLITVPHSTDTYRTVTHKDLADRLRTIGQDILRDFKLTSESYITARYGKHMFGLHNYSNGWGSGLGLNLSIGFCNSYDKTIAIGILVGGNVSICNNLVFAGNIEVIRKHTMHVWGDISQLAKSAIMKYKNQFDKIVADAEKMQAIKLKDIQAFETLGVLYGYKCLSPRQLTKARDLWLEPEYTEFEPRNLWSLYNNCTEALKTTPAQKRIERQCWLHKCVESYHLS